MLKALLDGAREMSGDAWFKRGALLGTGIGLKWLMDGPFDYILYPLVMWWTGMYFDSWVLGAAIMMIASIPFNWLQIRLYDAAKIDFFSLEALKSFEDTGEVGITRREKLSLFIKKWMRKSRLVAFIVLSANDPFYGVVYFRDKERAFDGLTKRDWMNFIAATIVANVYWAGLILLGFETIETAGEIGGFW